MRCCKGEFNLEEATLSILLCDLALKGNLWATSAGVAPSDKRGVCAILLRPLQQPTVCIPVISNNSRVSSCLAVPQASKLKSVVLLAYTRLISTAVDIVGVLSSHQLQGSSTLKVTWMHACLPPTGSPHSVIVPTLYFTSVNKGRSCVNNCCYNNPTSRTTKHL